ncbi:MAG: methylmalonyl-CoA epimerase [Candidatus Fraserbacteria bacterium RBG_16_55_9]|uniref:Methylmalonyl-CoA epimerase n=1 Tax=Fraserbacteria sp. (strain RBG_16_55_9) TaxID=1817864 RepID=A0A1F5UVM8_FRAXR|nr:MAG: methylmalonyl-CoA epimerase [Candidatus Fraserbacteria bacterium RBG_16_55_9]
MKLHHIGIAVQELEATVERFRVLGLKETERGIVEEFKVAASMIPAGEVKLEFLQPLGDGPIQRFLEKRGEGLHHVAFSVENLDQALSALKTRGIELIDEKPRAGFGGLRVAFLHPKSFGGVLVELVEERG